MDDQIHEEQIPYFERLKQIRLEKKLKLETISAKSKIHLRFLEALESGNLEEIPGVYNKLFFKTYLSFLQLENEQEYMDEFERLSKETTPLQTSTIRRVRVEKQDRRKSSLIKTIYIVAPLLVVAVIFAVLAINSTGVDEKDGNEEVQELSVQKIAEQMLLEQEKQAAEKADSTTIDTISVTADLSAVQRTWIRVIKDRADTTEYLLAARETLSLKADSLLNFLVGNAAGIKFTVNGSPVGILGKEGQVITRLLLTKQGIVSKSIKQIKKKETQNDSSAIQ